VSDEMTPAEALSERVAALTAEVQRLRGVVIDCADEFGRMSHAFDWRDSRNEWCRQKAASLQDALTPPAADTEATDGN